MTSDTLARVHTGFALRRKGDRLMAAVRTGDLTAPAADTLGKVELRIDDRVSLKDIRRIADGIQSGSSYLSDIIQPFLCEVEIQS